MKIERKWAMVNKWTFKVKPIDLLLKRYIGDGSGWLDPCSGQSTLVEYSNDLASDTPAKSHMDAILYMKQFKSKIFKGVLFDPPYSFAELLRCYRGTGRTLFKWGEFNDYWAKCRDEIARIIQMQGIAISFGWNSIGMGITRNFELIEILLVCHGGTRNDTIIVVERKIDDFDQSARFNKLQNRI